MAPPIEPFKARPLADTPLFKVEVYQQWLNSKGPRILFVKEHAGRLEGTSEQMFYALERRFPGQIILYFSFNRLDNRRNTAKNMLEAFISQLISHRDFSAFAKFMCCELEQGRGWTELDLMNWFERCIFLLRISFVINNLDGCLESSQRGLMSYLSRLTSGTERLFKVAITSSEPPLNTNDIPSTLFINLAGSKTNVAVDGNFLESYKKFSPSIPPSMEAIQRQLCGLDDTDPLLLHILYEQARSKRIWIEDFILGAGSEKAMSGKTVPSLEYTLDRIFRQIPDTHSVGQFLRWMVYAARPMTVWELATVFFVGSCHDQGSKISPSKSFLGAMIAHWESCYAGIIEICQNEVRLSNPRLRDIFMVPKADNGPLYLWNEIQETAELEITRSCLEYLSRDETREITESSLAPVLEWNQPSMIPPFLDPFNLLKAKVPTWW
ncbi:hypothetical protein HYFRA_00003714 [Hymenoscyphus fraxineus]|uniref:Nephrocystin 3-like N-terminal domain-containing protein n=1 Tax=Hymenoscyphus fraxineus TaxID=746836 RepID=A0A9N9KZI0_9HELO|nr:hypothetical protein HYFRA_00003714 [Hymenoscyphus fraxineus]